MNHIISQISSHSGYHVQKCHSPSENGFTVFSQGIEDLCEMGFHPAVAAFTDASQQLIGSVFKHLVNRHNVVTGTFSDGAIIDTGNDRWSEISNKNGSFLADMLSKFCLEDPPGVGGFYSLMSKLTSVSKAGSDLPKLLKDSKALFTCAAW